MKITAKQIKDIAESLEAGMNVYINKKTLEIIDIPDLNDLYGDTDFWEEELEKIENNRKDYISISKLSSRDAFRIMEDFADEVDDRRLREDLIKILNRRSPFANFKAEIDGSDYREQWFDFRAEKYQEYVREQLEWEEIEFEG